MSSDLTATAGPATADWVRLDGSPEVIDQHLEHVAVEFRSWILNAAAVLSRTPTT